MTRYRTILIDSPLPERGGGRIKRGADKHYPVMSIADIERTIYMCPMFRVHDDAHLYFWTTNNYLREVLGMIKFLDFEYKTMITWAKDKAGLGQYFRGQTEHLLFCTRRKGMSPDVMTEAKDIPTLVTAPRTRHSKKPEEFYELIERRSKGPYLEMFSRKRRDGWDSWGNEV